MLTSWMLIQSLSKNYRKVKVLGMINRTKKTTLAIIN